jgi:hypothetical protein
MQQAFAVVDMLDAYEGALVVHYMQKRDALLLYTYQSSNTIIDTIIILASHPLKTPALETSHE